MTALTETLSFTGKTALITGAAAGIGLATARRFAEAGAHLHLVDIDGATLKTVRDEINQTYEGAVVGSHVVDLADKTAIGQLWANVDQHESPQIIFNNAGIYPMRNFLDLDGATLNRVLDINLNAVFWMCQHFVRRRRKLGGIIVNVSSIEAILPFNESMAHYAASKAGVIALTRSLTRDYAADGIRANVIVPGGIRTPGTAQLAKQVIQRLDVGMMKTGYDFQQRLPTNRWGEPDEIAKVVIFLASDLASYVQGAVLAVDGGFLSS